MARCCSLRSIPRPNDTVPPCAPAFIVASRIVSPHPLRTMLTIRHGLRILMFARFQADEKSHDHDGDDRSPRQSAPRKGDRILISHGRRGSQGELRLECRRSCATRSCAPRRRQTTAEHGASSCADIAGDHFLRQTSAGAVEVGFSPPPSTASASSRSVIISAMPDGSLTSTAPI